MNNTTKQRTWIEYWVAIRDEEGDMRDESGAEGDFLYMGNSKVAAIKVARATVAPEGCTVEIERVTNCGNDIDGILERKYADIAF